MTAAAAPPPRTGLASSYALSIAGWLGFGALSTWNEHQFWMPNEPLWPSILLDPLVEYGPYALLWPLVLRGAALVHAAPRRRVPRYVALWLLAVLLHLLLRGVYGWLHDDPAVIARRGQPPGLWPRLLDELGRGFVMQGCWWAMLTGVAAGLAQRARIAAQERQATALREQLLAAQLAVLRSRLQPHFLFNALHAVAVVARRDAAQAERMLALLGDLLRESLRERTRDLVALGDEVALLRPYLELQQIRFQDRLSLRVDVPHELLRAEVPYLLLQPLVENALLHGIERKAGPGTVAIAATRAGDRLVLAVTDDGVGPPAGASDGVGLGTTRARLQALFGAAAALHLRRRDGGGTAAEVELPWREAAHG